MMSDDKVKWGTRHFGWMGMSFLYRLSNDMVLMRECGLRQTIAKAHSADEWCFRRAKTTQGLSRRRYLHPVALNLQIARPGAIKEASN